VTPTQVISAMVDAYAEYNAENHSSGTTTREQYAQLRHQYEQQALTAINTLQTQGAKQ
jgi:selenocysteine lyase/cysteine desulfurase